MIAFTDEERRVLDIIKEHGTSLSPKATPRLAGGFVRDKIMGISSHDIDVVLDNISGYSFALGLSKRVGNPSVHRVLANPDKSKHLETAIVHLYGFSIDFVHLRSESYTDTRIPSIRPGTPEEDANRRDITINSLFYNLVTGEVEDFTGRGLLDIRMGVIDTPLDPEITLFDDPLRILRIFRFKSKLSFEISRRIYEALGSQRMQNALSTKVSNERIGVEIFRMMEYSSGHEGLLEIISSGYVDPIFKPRRRVLIERHSAMEFHRRLLQLQPLMDTRPAGLRADQRILKLYAVLQYFLNMKVDAGKKQEYVNVLIMKESLKCSRAQFMLVKRIEECTEYIQGLDECDPVDVVITCKELWAESLALLFASTGMQKYRDLIFSILEEKCGECHLIVPLVDGEYLLARGVPVSRFRKMLRNSLLIQAKSPDMSREEIFEAANEMHRESK